MKRETEIRMNASPIAGIRSTYLQVDSRSHHRQSRRRMSEPLMREAAEGAWEIFRALFRRGVSSALSEDQGMDRERVNHNKTKFVGIRRCMAERLLYFNSLMLMTFMLRILLNRFVWVAACGTLRK